MTWPILKTSIQKIDKKSHKNINIYYIEYITIKDLDFENIHTVNPFYLVFDKEDR